MCPREAGVGRVHSDGRRDGLQFPALTEGQPHLALYLARRSGGVRPAAPGLAIQVAATIYDAAADTAAPAAAEVTIFTPIAQMSYWYLLADLKCPIQKSQNVHKCP